MVVLRLLVAFERMELRGGWSGGRSARRRSRRLRGGRLAGVEGGGAQEYGGKRDVRVC